jgi:leucyl/phenylalanyl-tRNA--protein transferase
VITRCSERQETWINAQIEEGFNRLHSLGHAHSIECWEAGELVGGLYGVKLGRAFFGESMFSARTDASKVALAWLVARLTVGGFKLLDCQFMTDHLRSLGAIEITQANYVTVLGSALVGASGDSGPWTGSWHPPAPTASTRHRDGSSRSFWARRRRSGARPR